MNDVWTQFATYGTAPADPVAASEATAERRERTWHACCQAGRCRYNAPTDQENPPPVDSTTHCGGYHGTRYQDLDTGRITWRWRPCARHLAWWEARKASRPSRRRRNGGYDE